MNDIKFSVLIPAYKNRFLRDAISSVLNQQYQNFELIIVDDCSQENLKATVDLFSDSRIRYYRNEKNCGAVDVVDNWNNCLNHSSGNFVICMGDDDILLPNCLEEYIRLIEHYPGLAVYHAWTEIIDEESKVYDIQEHRPAFESAYSLAWHRFTCRYKQFIGDFCFNREDLLSEGGFFKLPLAWASDDITAVRAALKAGVANTQVPCFQYRMSKLSISNNGPDEIKFQASIKEELWYKKHFSPEKCTALSGIDRLYADLIYSMLPGYFSQKRKMLISHDIEKHPVRLFHWLKKDYKDAADARTIMLGLIKSILRRKR